MDTMRAWILTCGLLTVLQPAWAQPVDAFVVRRIVVDGNAVSTIDSLTWHGPDGSENHRLAIDQLIAPGSRIETGAGVLLELERKQPLLRIVLQPRTRLVLQQSQPNAAQANVDGGSASFSLIGRQLDFYFGVSSFQKVFAIAKGTRFSVSAEAACEQGAGAGCVDVVLDEGRLELETRRPLQIGAAAATQPAEPAANDGDSTVTVGDTMLAGERREIALDPARFALRFDTWADAERHFAAELERASAGNDARATLRALRNESLILRLGGRNEEALAVARRGLALARQNGERVWQFRFLIDQGFATWQLRRDRSALPLFDAAFAMTDVTDGGIAPVDVAALYGRYGGIRFDARDRTQPQPDLDAAEDYLRRALRLREAESGSDGALDQSLSHYALGLLLRIGRNDYVGADRELERAVALRQVAFGGRDDLASAQMLAEAALGKEQLVYQRDAANPHDTAARTAEFERVRRRFDDSLGMLGRLFPGGNHRSIGAIDRRYGDFNTRLGQWWAREGQPAAAAAEFQAARGHYRGALDVFGQIPGNSSLERRYAYLGLGKAELLSNQPAAAADAFRAARVLALLERCSGAAEAPSLGWVDDLLARLAQAAELAHDPGPADDRRQAAAGAAAMTCAPANAAASAAAQPSR